MKDFLITWLVVFVALMSLVGGVMLIDWLYSVNAWVASILLMVLGSGVAAVIFKISE